MRSVVIAVAASLAASAGYADTRWIRLSESNDMVWEVKPGSLDASRTKGGADIAVVVGRVRHVKNKNVSVYQWYVTLEDCDREMGKVVSLDMDGKFRFETEFVFSAGSVASIMAEAICTANTMQVKVRSDKSI
jgi:hypothetical protein